MSKYHAECCLADLIEAQLVPVAPCMATIEILGVPGLKDTSKLLLNQLCKW